MNKLKAATIFLHPVHQQDKLIAAATLHCIQKDIPLRNCEHPQSNREDKFYVICIRKTNCIFIYVSPCNKELDPVV